MRLYGGNATLFGEVRSFLDVHEAGRARLRRNQADGQRPLVKVPHFFSGSADNNRSRLDAIFLEGQPEARELLRLEIVHKHLAGGESKIADLCHGAIRVPADAKD